MQLWQNGLQEYDELVGLDWEWQSLDGVMTKAPLGGGATGPNPTDRAKRGTKRRKPVRGAWTAPRCDGRWGKRS